MTPGTRLPDHLNSGRYRRCFQPKLPNGHNKRQRKIHLYITVVVDLNIVNTVSLTIR